MLLTESSAWSTTRDAVAKVALPRATSSYVPVPHLDFLNEIHDQLPAFGLQVVREDLSLARSGEQLFGVLSCRNGVEDGSYSLAIGLRNSYDRSLSCGLVAGVRVLVCSNLCFSGEVQMRRRHTKRVLEILRDSIQEMLGNLERLRVAQTTEINRLQDHELSDPAAHHLMVEVVKAGAFPASKLPKVIHDWDQPRHADFEDRSAWSLLNAFTEVQKERAPSAQMDIGLMRVFREALRV